MADDESPEGRLGYEGWRVAGAAGAGVFFASLVAFAFPVFFVPITREFGWSRTAVAAAFGTARLSAGLTAPFVGALVDRFDARWVSGVSLAMLACAFGSLALLTPHLWHLYLVYLVVGLATAGTSTVVYARVISSWFTAYRGRALALVASSSAIGTLVHPPVASALMRWGGWRTACLLLGAVILAVGVPSITRYIRSRPATAVGSTSRAGGSGVTISEALRSRVFVVLLVVLFGSTLALNGAVVHMAALLTDRGVSPAGAALTVSALGAASLLGRALTGWLLDRFSAERTLMALLVVAALGTFILAGAESPSRGIVAAALLGFGTGGEADALPYLLAKHFGLRSLSALYGVNWMALGLAGAVGPVLMGRAYDVTGSYAAVLIAFSAVTLGTALLMFAVPHRQSQAAPAAV